MGRRDVGGEAEVRLLYLHEAEEVRGQGVGGLFGAGGEGRLEDRVLGHGVEWTGVVELVFVGRFRGVMWSGSAMGRLLFRLASRLSWCAANTWSI